MWYNGSGANVSYQNFGEFSVRDYTHLNYYYGLLYLFTGNLMKWKISLAYSKFCSICQKGKGTYFK